MALNSYTDKKGFSDWRRMGIWYPFTFSEVLQMPGPKALKIELTDAESEHIEKTVRKRAS